MKNKRSYKQIYHDYLRSDKWKQKREDLFKIRGRRCERYVEGKCSNKIEVHHKTYENIFDEKLEDLEVLCNVCHRKEHKIDTENAIKAIKILKDNGHSFFIIKGLKRIKYNGYSSKKDKKQRSERQNRKAIDTLKNNKLENKGKIVRRLKKLGINEYKEKSILYYSLEELQTIFNDVVKIKLNTC